MITTVYLFLTSTSTDSGHVKFFRYHIKVSYSHHDSNFTYNNYFMHNLYV
jgi:hypothetical protein